MKSLFVVPSPTRVFVIVRFFKIVFSPITEFEIIKVNPKTIKVIGCNGEKLVKKSWFDGYRRQKS